MTIADQAVKKETPAHHQQASRVMPTTSQHPETVILHASYRSDPTTNAVAVPIHQTTSDQFCDTNRAADLFALNELGNIHTRIMSPTTVDDIVADLDQALKAA